MKNINKYAPMVAVLFCVFFSMGCATASKHGRGQDIVLSISESGYVQGKDQIEQMIGINDAISQWYSDTGDATIRYACNVKQINRALQNIYQYSESSDTEIKVSFANGPLEATPFRPLAVNAEPIRYGLSIFIVNQTKQLDFSSKEIEWMIHFEFNLSNDEIREVAIPELLPVGFGGDLGSFIEFHENRRKAKRLHGNDCMETTWRLFRGTFE